MSLLFRNGVFLLAREGEDDVAETGERFVDGLRLLETIARGAGSTESFAPGEVN